MKPSEEFTIKLLSDEDFDKLPYADAKGSLGMSVMATKTAYIRRTGIKDMDQGTINHEFDELMQQSSPHEINGIRYKSVGQVFLRIAKSIAASFFGGPIAGIASDVFSTIEGVGQERAGNRAKKQSKDFQRQQNEFFSSFQPSGATQAFAPQTTSAGPLGLEQFNTSLSNLDKNRQATQQGVFSQFRGQSPRGASGSSAFQTALSSAKSSSDLARNQFLEDQTKLGSTFV